MGPADDVDTDLVASEARRHPAIEDFVLWLTVERAVPRTRWLPTAAIWPATKPTSLAAERIR